MTHSTNLSSEVRNAVDKFHRHIYSNPTLFSKFVSDNEERCLLFSLYALRDDANQKVLEVTKDSIVDLRSCLEKEEINLLSDNYLALLEDFKPYYQGIRDSIPEEILTLCSSLVSVSSIHRVYLPYAGAGDFLEIVSQGAGSMGFEQNPLLWGLCQIRQQMLGIAGNISLSDPLNVQDKYDRIFTSIRNITKWYASNDDVQGIVNHLTDIATNHLAEKGKMFCVLPSCFCYEMKFWYQLRKSIVDNKLSAMIISLPEELYPSFFSKWSPWILVIENDYQGHIVLIDASEEYFLDYDSKSLYSFVEEGKLKVDVLLETITSKDEKFVWVGSVDTLDNHLSFSPYQYLPIIPDYELTKGEVAISIDSFIESVNGEPGNRDCDYPMLSSSLLSKNYLNCDIYVQDINKKEIEEDVFELFSGRTLGHIITEDCLVANYRNKEMKVARIHGVSKTTPLALPCSMFAFKLRKSPKVTSSKGGKGATKPCKANEIITEDYLLRSLTSTIVLKQAKAWSHDSVQQTKKILECKIFVPSIEVQVQRCKEDATSSLKAADLRIQKAYDEYRKDVRMKKHAIGQTVFNLKNWWDNLNLARQKGNGVVSDADTIGVTHKITVDEIYRNLDITMSKLSTQLSKFDSGYGLSREEFALPTFLEQYIAEHRSPIFTFEYDTNAYLQKSVEENEKANDTNVDKQPSITFSKEALTMVLNNIVSNACTHGFQGRPNEQNKIKLAIQSQGTDYILIVANNGAPLKDDFQKEDVFVYGQTSGETQEHYGIGGYEIKRLMNEFEGDVELFANSESEYSVAYKLIFHNTHLTND